MDRYHQQGMSTLLITSMLLVVALIFSLASYKNLFYQIKRTQNEVLARQAYWAEEGGLECGFAAIQYAGSISGASATFNDCESLLNLSKLEVDSNNNIISNDKIFVEKEIRKKIKLSSRLAGAIQARSNLKLIGDYDIFPDVEGKHSNGDYKCVSIRYSNRFIFDKTESGNVTTELVVKDPIKNGPYSGFDGKCAAGYHSHLKETTDSFDNNTKDNLKNDFVYDSQFDPFESVFNNTRSEIDTIKKEFEEIDGSKTNCDEKIRDAFLINNKVWVSGHCDLMNGTLVGGLNKTARLLVIENGIFATYGAVEFYGMVYHLYTDSIIDMSSSWTGMHSGNTLSSADKKKAVYFQSGAFIPVGGLVLDAPQGLSVFHSSMSFKFKGDANPNDNSQISWVEGSWHDF
ncbi:hypothetical protein FD722_18025 [Photobacterium damselae subsp. damselae]|uniref:Type 4 fimbrial biogenesis protein PilX N-terminal domain-containing protein n=1 Tax=Photobacterium damselae subsp. damselae TaxID=85581 RepID=A0A850R5Q4_PHODD|nr:hypothetical protein [Photobacterium damselae]MBA5682922.1 hypothetical protein [Photobacterium damselae subsp. damselae]NVH51009.1 hypothetical protein [Photobacterium damselae subsp. damselae]NVO79617.1 hypothetical protein [Photobacterium damselae subsp. damselae]NVP02779.1 hypothetical protein [Photobacterium damselae subsp. damselae]TLS81652.1 hypothetical protein FD719_13260 [Photobacterium damselae subsp. damselae]